MPASCPMKPKYSLRMRTCFQQNGTASPLAHNRGRLLPLPYNNHDQSQARAGYNITGTIVYGETREHLPPPTRTDCQWRSLSETFNRRFDVIQRHQPLRPRCSRFYSSPSAPLSASSSQSSPSSPLESGPSQTQPDIALEKEQSTTATQEIPEEDVEDYLLISECDPIDPEMLTLK